jgi:hypothetical protein
MLLCDSEKISEKVANLIKADNNVSLVRLVTALEYPVSEHKSIAEIHAFFEAEYKKKSPKWWYYKQTN